MHKKDGKGIQDTNHIYIYICITIVNTSINNNSIGKDQIHKKKYLNTYTRWEMQQENRNIPKNNWQQ